MILSCNANLKLAGDPWSCLPWHCDTRSNEGHPLPTLSVAGRAEEVADQPDTAAEEAEARVSQDKLHRR